MTHSSRLFAALLITALASGCAATTGADAADDTGASADELSKARFTSLKAPTSKKLASLYTAGSKFENAYRGVYRFNKASAEATDPDARMKRVKEVMHRYMCGFFDESIDLGHSSGPSDLKATLSDINMDDNASDQTADVASFSSSLSTVLSDSHLDVMSGSASGNNTMGEIMGVYDKTHNEVLFFGFTNCGSDD